MFLLSDDDLKRLRDLSGDLDLTSLELVADVAEDYGLILGCTTVEEMETPAQPSIHVSSRLASNITRSCIPATDDSSKYDRTPTEEGAYGRLLWISFLMTDNTMS